MWIVETLIPAATRPSSSSAEDPGTGSRVAGADGDVRGRVLVEEAVPEDDAAPPDRGVDVDESDLAEP
jgi:hypothetical protein